MLGTDWLRKGRLLAVAGALSALAVALLASLAVATASTGGQARGADTEAACANASEPAVELKRAQHLRKAVRCLVNAERKEHGAKRLSREPSLRRAAQQHSEVMVATDCLAHRCGDEPSLKRRVSKAGYFDRATKWEYAENTGCALSAEAMVASWMDSQMHRRLILDRAFREIGVGVEQAPVASLCEPDYATFAIVAGWRKLER